MQLSNFAGGLSTRLDPSLIEVNEATVYSNIDNAVGILQSANDITLTNTMIGGYFYNFKDSWLSSTFPRSYVEYQEILYYSEQGQAVKRFNGVRTINLGIIGPTVKPVATQQNPVATEKISSSASVLQYCYTYYNSEDDIESVPSEVSDELNLAANKVVDLTGITASTDIQVDKIRVYRIGDGITTMTLIEEIPNTTATYRDDTLTLDLDGHILDSYNSYPPEVGMQYIIEAYGILFGCVGDKLYYSDIGKHHSFPKTNVIDFPKEIMGLLEVPNGILISNDSKTKLLVGTSNEDFALQDVSSEQGSVSHFSGNKVSNKPIWLSKEGICFYNSAYIDIVSRAKLGNLALEIVNTAVINEQYYILLLDGSLLVMDLRFNSLLFKRYTFSQPLANILAHENVLYGRVGDKLCTLFTGNELTLNYMSPNFTEGNHSARKLYNNIYVRYNGTFTISVYIDDALVETYDITGNDIADLKVPEDKQRGSSIRFGVTGIGKIYEIEYKVLGRQNGR